MGKGTRVWIPPHMSVRDGKPFKVEGYWRRVGVVDDFINPKTGKLHSPTHGVKDSRRLEAGQYPDPDYLPQYVEPSRKEAGKRLNGMINKSIKDYNARAAEGRPKAKTTKPGELYKTAARSASKYVLDGQVKATTPDAGTDEMLNIIAKDLKTSGYEVNAANLREAYSGAYVWIQDDAIGGYDEEDGTADDWMKSDYLLHSDDAKINEAVDRYLNARVGDTKLQDEIDTLTAQTEVPLFDLEDFKTAHTAKPDGTYKNADGANITPTDWLNEDFEYGLSDYASNVTEVDWQEIGDNKYGLDRTFAGDWPQAIGIFDGDHDVTIGWDKERKKWLVEVDSAEVFAEKTAVKAVTKLQDYANRKR